jgi:hypothetical protein
MRIFVMDRKIARFDRQQQGLLERFNKNYSHNEQTN